MRPAREAGIFAKRGLFKTHTYSQEELLNHPLFDSIRAICGQIDNVVQPWLSNLSADSKIAKFYYENRILVEQKLSSLRAEIVRRKPTFWEALLHTLESLIRDVLRLLPALPATLLGQLGIRVPQVIEDMRKRSEHIDAFLDGPSKK